MLILTKDKLQARPRQGTGNTLLQLGKSEIKS